MGRKKQPHYRIVVADSSSPRDGRFVENLGYYKPLTHPARLVIDLERVDHWITEGALPSGTVKNLIDRARKGGDDKVVVGTEDVEARKKDEAEALHERRAVEKKAETKEAGAKKAEADPVTVPQDETDEPAGSSASDETPAEAEAEAESPEAESSDEESEEK